MLIDGLRDQARCAALILALLSPPVLSAEGVAQGPWPSSAFTPPRDALAPARPFEGELVLSGGGPTGLRVHRDDFDLADNASFRVGEFPPVTLTLVSDGTHLVPRRRGPLSVEHPYWEFIPEPGRVWAESEDSDWSRAVMPFAFKESNQNCLHNGLLSFRYGSDGAVSNVSWQVASETCAYLKIDAWGMFPADYRPRTIPEAAALKAAYRKERSERLPVRSLADLKALHPDIDLDALAPPANDDATVYGVVLDGVHYRSDCPTRLGPHPFCALVAVPSYSTAKSLFAGLTFLHMVRRWPELETLTVTELVPECALPDGRWQAVRLRHLANMTTGNFASNAFHADEASTAMQTFFLAASNSEKLRFSCEAWPRKASPGAQAVYHSTDHYLLGVALQRFLDRETGGELDLHRDLFVDGVLAGLKPGPLVGETQRTYDEDAQPFVSHGLYFHADDVARIGQALQDDDYLASLINSSDLAGIRFRDRSGMQAWRLSRGEGYFAGFWGFDIAPHAGCEVPSWVPFMSGYGGIRWALPPGGAVYYFFSDGGHGSWMDAIIELSRVSPVCTPAPAAG